MTIQEYLTTINKRFQTGLSTEHTYRGDLQNLLESIAYGMFAARLHAPTLNDFSRQEAAELIPKLV